MPKAVYEETPAYLYGEYEEHELRYYEKTKGSYHEDLYHITKPGYSEVVNAMDSA